MSGEGEVWVKEDAEDTRSAFQRDDVAPDTHRRMNFALVRVRGEQGDR